MLCADTWPATNTAVRVSRREASSVANITMMNLRAIARRELHRDTASKSRGTHIGAKDTAAKSHPNVSPCEYHTQVSLKGTRPTCCSAPCCPITPTPASITTNALVDEELLKSRAVTICTPTGPR